MEKIDKLILQDIKSIQDHVMILQLTINSFELQYGRFMDKNTRKDFELIKKSVDKVTDLIR